MDFRTYQITYITFKTGTYTTKLINIFAHEMLEDFPYNLSGELIKKFSENLKTIDEALPKAVEKAKEYGITLKNSDKELAATYEVSADPFTTTAFILGVLRFSINEDKPFENFEFERYLNLQALVMLIGHLEAFMADTLKAICKKRPEILRRDKTVTWKEIVDSSSKEELIDRMIEEYSLKFSFKPISKKLEFWEKNHGIKITISEHDILKINVAEQNRNIILHNNAQVSQEYLNRTGKTDLSVGDIVPIDIEYLENTFVLIENLASKIYEEVAQKFFDADQKDLFRYFS